jgi:hypothetical protein
MPALSTFRSRRLSGVLPRLLAPAAMLMVALLAAPMAPAAQPAVKLSTPSIVAPPAVAPTAGPSSAAASSAVFDLNGNREPLVSLDTGWRFHPGDDPGWAAPDFDDSAWPILRGDEPWSEQGYRGMSGFAWYRFTLVAPERDEPLALELAPIMTSYGLYIDGRFIAQTGSAPRSIIPAARWSHELYELPAPRTPQPGGLRTIHIAIRVWHSPIWSSYMGGGPESDGNLFGSSALLRMELKHRDGRRQLLFVDLFAYTIAALIISLTIFGLYAFRPKEHEYLWFALMILAKAVDAGLSISKELYAVPSVPIFDLLDSACVAAAQVALMLFLTRVLHLKRNPLWYALMGMIAVSPLVCISYWPGWLSVPDSAMMQIFLLVPSSIWVLVILVVGAFRRNVTARLLVVPVFLVQGFWVADNVIIVCAQRGLPIYARWLETPFIVSPYSVHPAILAELLFLLAMLAFLIRRFTIARQREERYDGELEAARQVQQVLLPEEIAKVPGFTVDCVYHPAESVGGDFFQILPAPDGGLLVVVGDVAGKGLPAALMVSVLVGAIRAEATHSSDPAVLMASFNERAIGRSQGKFTTCLCLHISAQGIVTAASAGHLNPYVEGVEISLEPALPLGIIAQARYDASSFTLAPGQRLTIVSDGVLEAQARDGELLGFERTRQLSTQSAAEIAAAAQAFGQNDDITVVTVAFDGSTVEMTSGMTAKAIAS